MTDQTPTTPADTKAAHTGTDGTPPAGTTTSDPALKGPALKGPDQKPGEIGGPKGPEPTRYGDWEFKGRCSDF